MTSPQVPGIQFLLLYTLYIIIILNCVNKRARDCQCYLLVLYIASNTVRNAF